MEKRLNHKLPKQIAGKQVEILRERHFNDAQEAVSAFAACRKKLLDINKWKNIAGEISSTFHLLDKFGRETKQSPAVGDYVKINVPGPGPIHGAGCDWVTITKLEDNGDQGYVLIRLQPAPPQTNPDSDKVAHFFQPYSSTTIILELNKDKINISYFGRNEVVNTNNENIIDDVRNFIVGTGAKLGLSYPQWEKLVEGILE